MDSSDFSAWCYCMLVNIRVITSVHTIPSLCAGLTCHQSRPFTMASCSRDSTVRLWSLTPLISPLLLNIVTEQPWEKIIGNTGEARSLLSNGVLPRKCSDCAPWLYFCRHSSGSRLAPAALWQSVSGHQAGAG